MADSHRTVQMLDLYKNMPHIFISYPDEEENIVGNLRSRFREYGVDAWAYSYDKTLAQEAWKEIEEKINQSQVMIFIASEYTDTAEGQYKELDLVFNKIINTKQSISILPVVIRDFKFSDLPEKIRYINGERLNAYNVGTVALTISQTLFPQLFLESQSPKWEYPRPGEWLGICNLDSIIEEYCNIGDKLYFRRISPLGLFECYFPKINGLFWISPKNVKRTEIIDESGDIEREQVPVKYRFMTSWECERKGYEILFLNKKN
jgi:hypothetical protein